jgi:hypothetical protein
MRTQGRVDVKPPPTAGGLFTLRETCLCSVERGLSLLFSALFNDRPASLFLINTPPQPPNPSAKITTSSTDKDMSLSTSIYRSFPLSSITQPVTESIPWAVSAKNNYFTCWRLTVEVYNSSFPSACFGRKQTSFGSLLNDV